MQQTQEPEAYYPVPDRRAEGLRDRRRRETRTLIRTAAISLVRQHGLDGVTVEMISTAAGVSTRTFFNYFPHKDAALVAGPPPLVQRAMAEFLAMPGPNGLFADIEELFVGHVREAMFDRSELAAIYDVVRENPKLLSAQLAAYSTFERQLSDLILARLGQGESETATLMAAVTTTAVRVALQRWCQRSEQPTAEGEVRRYFGALRRLLATPATAELVDDFR